MGQPELTLLKALLVAGKLDTRISFMIITLLL